MRLKYDRRWVLIRRPTIVVGGELTLDYLETRFNKSAGIAEAPVQLKSNCGTLVIDDFGRQRVSSTEILNRLIVPLEKHYDFLYLASGRQIQVPFDELLGAVDQPRAARSVGRSVPAADSVQDRSRRSDRDAVPRA